LVVYVRVAAAVLYAASDHSASVVWGAFGVLLIAGWFAFGFWLLSWVGNRMLKRHGVHGERPLQAQIGSDIQGTDV